MPNINNPGAGRAAEPKNPAAIRVAVIGAKGRMGSLACGWIEESADLLLCARLDLGNPIGPALAAAKADVALDFTTAASALQNALAIVGAGARPVIGTSGLTAPDLDKLRGALESERLGGIVVPN